MTPTERIAELCQAALENPDITVTEKRMIANAEQSAAYTAAPGKAPEEAAPAGSVPEVAPAPTAASSPAPAAASAAAPAAASEPAEAVAGEAAPQVAHTEQDEELKAMLEEREQKLSSKQGRVRTVVNVMLILLIVAPVATVASVPSLRGKFETFVMHLKTGVKDVKQMGNTKEAYDEALKDIAVRNDHINGASEMLGVDPDSVDESDDLEMTAELKQFMGEDADQFGDRKASLEKMGFVARKVSGIGEEEEGE